MGRTFAPLGGELGDSQRLVSNPTNVSKGSWKKLWAMGAGNNSAAVARQALSWVESDRFTSLDGSIDYAARLGEVHVPVLVIAGKGDHIATVSMVKAAYQRLGGPREFEIAGVENGFSADYGHADFLIGNRIADELWPRIASFLDRHGDW
jgi:pimeloyl-ACP methyl ester carboxylesterase